MVREFRSKLFLRSLQVSVPQLYAMGSHDPAYRIYHDAPALQWITIYGFFPVIISVTSLCGILYVTALINLRLALVALVTSVPLIVLIHVNQQRLRGRWHKGGEACSTT